MATRTNLEFTVGENWEVTQQCCDASGVPLNITGGTLHFRIATSAALLWDLSSPPDVIFTDAPTGMALVSVTPAMQSAKGIDAGVLVYESRVVLANGAVSDQNYGNLTVRCSLFKRYA